MIKIYAMLAALLLSAAGAGWLGYKVGHAAADRLAAQNATQAAEQWQGVVTGLRGQVTARDQQLADQIQRTQALTAGWLQENRQLAARADKFQREVAHAHFTVGTDCRSGSSFVRLYNAAAEAGGHRPAAASTAAAPLRVHAGGG